MASKIRAHALITGASSGIGAAFAERLAHDNHDLILVARRRDKLEALAERLKETHQVNVEVLVADLSQKDGLHAVEKRIAEDTALVMLVNNAGFGGYGPFVDRDPEKIEEQLNLHILALTRLTRAALPGMLARRHGNIVNVSSRLAFSGSMGSSQLPKRATYVGTKAYINAFTQLVQSELEGSGVRLQALCPGVVATEFHTLVGTDSSRFPAAIVMTPEDVVSASLIGLDLGEVICIPTLGDPALLAQIHETEQTFFDVSRSGSLAMRYISR